ncbi:MAG: adenylyltransferase/cytidyltransferase family protein [Bacteroidetes bacterium]|jgi:riboflavin kinase/FMN adenylyltransferase|nr:adenylyltransferase/cytidyltransferase family protein [Bacteroidota bacterium]
MRIFRSFKEAKGLKNPVVTTGSFDGVHIGHKTIINRLKMLAERYDGESLLITFDPHPRKVLYPETAGRDLKLINSQEEKLELLSKAGLDNVIIIEFTREFSRITSEEFVKEYLKAVLQAKVVVVGFNHHFGFNQEGDYKHLWRWKNKYNFEAEEIPEQEVYNETVSSTKIRKAIKEGYIQRANAYLDHYYMVIGYPQPLTITAPEPFRSLLYLPLTDECKLLPATGIYAVSVICDQVNTKGMAFIRQDQGKPSEIYIHIFGDNKEVTGKKTTVLFHKMIHGSFNHYDSGASKIFEQARTEVLDLIY